MMRGNFVEVVERMLRCLDQVFSFGNSNIRNMDSDLKGKLRSTSLERVVGKLLRLILARE